MKRHTLPAMIILAANLFMILAACATAPATPSEKVVLTGITQTQLAQPTSRFTPTAVPPTITPTAILPTSTSIPDYIKATSLDDIVGTWYNPNKKLYLRFYDDGFVHHSHSLNALDADPHAKTEVWFEETRLYLKTKEVHGVPSCGDAIGIYEVRLYPKGNIQIMKIKDSCSPRSGEMALPLTPVID